MEKITLETRQQSITWTPKEILTEFTSFSDFTQRMIVDDKLRLEIGGSDQRFVYARNIGDKIKLTAEGLRKRYYVLSILLYLIGASVVWFRERIRDSIILNKNVSRNLGLMVNVLLWLGLLITTIAVFVPLFPRMPGASLDQSWIFATNQAVDQGLSFGKEIIFTFGPYASIFTKAYHPSTDFMMVSGSLYLALSYWACFVLLMNGVKWRWILAFCVPLVGAIYSTDALSFSFPLLAGLTTFKTIFSEDGALAKSKYAPFCVAVIFAPFGLLPLVKGSILILCCAIAALCSVSFIVMKKRALAIICLASPVVTMLLFWIASGQSATLLPHYFIGMAHIVSGYTEAMAIYGNIREVILYLVAASFILLTISLQKQINNISKILLVCIMFVYLFLSLKAGFVRHDRHAVGAGTSILIAALLLSFIFNSSYRLPVIAFSLITWYYIHNNHIKMAPASIARNIISAYSSPWNGLIHRIEDRNWLRHIYDMKVNSLREQAAFPVLQGTADIYSCHQSYLISSGNTWSPRPIFQSYCAYTAWMAEENRKHLLGGKAPDNIIFRVEPIDRRLASIEDGASWPILLHNYQPTWMTNDYLFLREIEGAGETAKPSEISREKHVFGENVILPRSNQPIFARIEIMPTIIGRIASILFKPSQLKLALELNNGRKIQYRIIAGMAKSGFMISPLIENTQEFGMLYGESSYLNEKLVQSFAIGPSHGKTRLWNDKYTVTLSHIRRPARVDLSNIYCFDSFDDELSGSRVTSAETSIGWIDVVNNTYPLKMNHFSASGLLRVTGWLVASVDEATLPEAVYVVLTDDLGNRSYIRTRRTPRPDIGVFLKKPELANSGFSTLTDISALEGQYTLGLAFKQSDKIMICPQFKIPVRITK